MVNTSIVVLFNKQHFGTSQINVILLLYGLISVCPYLEVKHYQQHETTEFLCRNNIARFSILFKERLYFIQ